MEETLGRSSALIMACRKRRTTTSASGPAAFKASARRTSCGAASRLVRRPAGRRRVEQALAAVDAAGPLHDIALVDELLQHAPEALLGDFQHVEQIGDAQAGMAGDEVQHAMVGPAEAEILQDRIGVAGEIAIGEEQQFGVGERAPRRSGARPAPARRFPAGRRFASRALSAGIYVSHVDLFLACVRLIYVSHVDLIPALIRLRSPLAQFLSQRLLRSHNKALNPGRGSSGRPWSWREV